MDSRGLITEANRKRWTIGAMCLSFAARLVTGGRLGDIFRAAAL